LKWRAYSINVKVDVDNSKKGMKGSSPSGSTEMYEKIIIRHKPGISYMDYNLQLKATLSIKEFGARA